MAKNAKKVIIKENWVSNFNLIGVPKINDYTFKIDEKSEKSSWIYNSMNIGIDCGEKFGTVYAEMMGGYSSEQPNAIYAHGKKDDDSDDFSQQITVDWDDRFNESILETIGDLSFITVGLEKTTKGNTYYKKFLSAYDAIAYIKEHLEDDMVVNVRGNLKYSMYQDKVQVRKNITSIVLSKVEDASKYVARFTQTVLIDKASASLKNIDKDKGVMYVEARVLDYLKEYNGIEVKGQYPYAKTFEFEMDFSNEVQCKKIMEKVFKVKKGITQITFEGDLIEGGAVVTATLDDIPQDIKDLIDCGVYTEEEALARCSSNGNREQRMVLRKPMVRLVGDDKIPTLQRFEERYTEDDLVLDYLYNESDTSNDEHDDDVESTDADDDLDWLSKL
jgi:transposase-like protein